MKKINLKATKVFLALLNKLATKEQLNINAPATGLLPLALEKREDNVLIPLGVATVYSLFHPYTEQGQIKYAPEMRFLVVDSRKHPGDANGLAIVPFNFRSDKTGDEEESITLRRGLPTHIKQAWQAGHAHAASEWLIRIKQQGYLR